MEKVTGILWYVKWFTLVFIFALLVDVVYVFWPYPEVRGVAVLQRNVEAETALITSLSSHQAQMFIQTVQQWLYQPVFVWTGLHDFLILGMQPHDTSITTSAEMGRGLANGFREQIQTAYLGLLLFSQRLAVLALAAPLFVAVMLAALIDGVVSWYKRRTSVGRESGFIYHRAKHGFNHTILMVWILYLLPPVVIDPRWVIPPALLLVGLSFRLAVGFFKKYL